jgi:hypothetical protein
VDGYEEVLVVSRWALSDLIGALAPRGVTLAGLVMWLCTASSSLATKLTSEQER